jgi:hypothetical protein
MECSQLLCGRPRWRLQNGRIFEVLTPFRGPSWASPGGRSRASVPSASDGRSWLTLIKLPLAR